MVPVENRGNLDISRDASPATLSQATSKLLVYPFADAGFADSIPTFLFTELNSVTTFRTDIHDNQSGLPFLSAGWTPERGASGDRIPLESLIGDFYAASIRRSSSRRLGYVKSPTSMVRRTAPIQHQPKLRGDIHVIPLSNWQAKGIRRPSHSPRKFSLITPQEYYFGGISQSPSSQTGSSQNETEENQNSRDSGSSSEDGGKQNGSW